MRANLLKSAKRVKKQEMYLRIKMQIFIFTNCINQCICFDTDANRTDLSSVEIIHRCSMMMRTFISVTCISFLFALSNAKPVCVL